MRTLYFTAQEENDVCLFFGIVDVDEENSRAYRLDSLFSKFDLILYALSLPVWIQRGGSVRRRFSMGRIS